MLYINYIYLLIKTIQKKLQYLNTIDNYYIFVVLISILAVGILEDIWI